MSTPSRFTSDDIFTNSEARDAGFTEAFWLQALAGFHETVNPQPDGFLNNFEGPYTVRVPFHQGEVDVIVRVNDRPADTIILRFTAFQTESSQDDRLDKDTGEPGPDDRTPPCWTTTAHGDHLPRSSTNQT